MANKQEAVFSRHAVSRWRARARHLGLDEDQSVLLATFRKAVPEIPKDRTTRWNLFKRFVLHGSSQYLAADGWRFVVAGGICVTVERLKQYENSRATDRRRNMQA
ncbi:MAG: hypothetical protein ABSA46_04245 [Thermodesulfovibrionales bacterium]|jgi:hypothetical protein